MTVFAPIFVDGVLRGFSGAKAHWNDVGAKEAGYVSDSTEIFQEGLRLPPMRIVEAGELDGQLLELIALNSRFPGPLVGDLHASLTACRTGEERFRSIVERYGWPEVEASIESFFAQAEAADRASVAAIPDGDLPGRGLPRRRRDQPRAGAGGGAVTVAGDELTIDLAGSGLENEGSINSGIVQTRSALQQAFKFVVNPNAPVCGGSFRNLDDRGAAGQLLRPLADGRLPALRAAPDAGHGPHRPGAQRGGARAHGRRPRRGLLERHLRQRARPAAVPVGRVAGGRLGRAPGRRRRERADPLGRGGLQELPGRGDGAPLPAGASAGMPCARAPGGAGEHRGGLGIERIYEVLEPCRLSLWFERTRTPSWGLDGGEAGAPPQVHVIGPGAEPRLVLKCNAVPIPAGTVVHVQTAVAVVGNRTGAAAAADKDVRLGLSRRPARHSEKGAGNHA